MSDVKPNLTVMAIFRNEAPYLAEWVAFHLAQGVDRFVLFNNRSTDGWEDALRPFADVVTVIHWDYPAPCQMQAYAAYFGDVQEGRLPGSRWTAVLDCDEFLMVGKHETKTLPQVIEEVSRNGQAPAVAVNWMIYNGMDKEQPGGSVEEGWLGIESNTLRCDANHPANRHVKSIVDPLRVVRIATPHAFAMRGMPVDEMGRPAPDPLTETPSHARLRINHYFIRSRREWEQKVARGRADDGTTRATSEADGYPAVAVDASAAVWGPKTRQILEERGVIKAVLV